MTISSSFNKYKLAIPAGFRRLKDYIPNGWGKETYAGKVEDAKRVNRIDTNNMLQKKGWILAYAAKHFSQVQFVEDIESTPTRSSASLKKIRPRD